MQRIIKIDHKKRWHLFIDRTESNSTRGLHELCVLVHNSCHLTGNIFAPVSYCPCVYFLHNVIGSNIFGCVFWPGHSRKEAFKLIKLFSWLNIGHIHLDLQLFFFAAIFVFVIIIIIILPESGLPAAKLISIVYSYQWTSWKFSADQNMNRVWCYIC